MRVICYIICILLITGVSCNKKDKPAVKQTPATPVIPDTGLKCQNLPPTPEPFGWRDSVIDVNKSINAFLFDPVNPDQIIFVVNGDAFGYNKLFFYTIPTQQARYICTLGKFLPQVNHKGWITFSDVENNIYLIKDNGTQIIALTSNKRSLDPKWDHTGNYIYYYAEPILNIKSQLVKMDTNGTVMNSFATELPHSASFKKTDRLIVLETKNDLASLRLKSLTEPSSERILITGPLYSKPGEIYFNNLTLDNNDEHVYWSNSLGIFRCNLNSLKVDTLFKNCENFIYNNPIVSFKDNELTYSHEVIIPIGSETLLHRYKAMEMNTRSGQTREIKIFP